MNICMVSREFPPETHLGGIGSYTYKTSAALARLGHTVHVITAAAKEPVEYQEGGVTVHRIQEPARRGPLPVSLAHARAVAGAISGIPGRLDVVQACEWGAEAAWYALMPSRRAPLVTRLATPLFVVRKLNETAPARWRLRGALTSGLERFQTRRSDGIISPTRALASIVCEGWGIAPDRVSVVPTGATLGTSDPASDPPLPQSLAGLSYILYFGRLERRKGVLTLGEALPAVMRAHPNITAVFVGEDVTYEGQPMADAIRALAAPYADRLVFLPRMAQRDLFPIIRAARVVVLPSLWENLANTCLEAMQLARPVIATWGCGFEEVIQDQVSGYLTPPGDAAALAQRIIATLDDPPAAERAGQAACARAAEFGVDLMAARLVAYYEGLLASRTSGATVAIESTPDSTAISEGQAG